MNKIKVQQLFLYPVKSLQGTEVEQIAFDKLGPVNDRRWVLVDENYKFLTQRETPKLAQFKVEIRNEKLEISLKQEKIEIEMEKKYSEKKIITVWGHQGESYDCGSVASDFFSSHLGKKISLFKISEIFNRKDNVQTSDISFVDARQILIANEQSLNWLNQEIEKEKGEVISMNRFRANIIINEESFFEDKITLLKNEKIELSFERKCGRCVVITTDQVSGERRGTLPLKILAKRSGETTFGVYFSVRPIAKGAICKKDDFFHVSN